MGTTGTSIQSAIRNVIQDVIGTTVTLKLYASASVSTNDEGDETITYGAGSSVKAVIGANNRVLRDLGVQGEETVGDLVLVFKDTQALAQKDAVVLSSVNYIIDEIKDITVDDELVARRATLHRED
jgi:hypothetical protein